MAVRKQYLILDWGTKPFKHTENTQTQHREVRTELPTSVVKGKHANY